MIPAAVVHCGLAVAFLHIGIDVWTWGYSHNRRSRADGPLSD
jgi:hypothetical protein